MNAFTYILPWTTPAPIGLIVGTGFAQLAFLLAPLLLVMDAVMYYPFFRVYDAQLVEREKAGVTDEVEEEMESASVTAAPAATAEEVPEDEKRVLVLCASGATSSMLAKAITKGAEHRHAPVESIAMAYGQHKDIITDFDLVVLAPQMASMYDELKSDCDAKGVKSVTTSGREYVGLTRDPDKALDFALALMAH